MKKRISILLTAVLLVTAIISGCSGSGNKETTGQSKDTAANTESTGGSTTAKVIELTFPNIWVGADSKAKVFGQMIEDFNQAYEGKYKVKVEEQTDYDAYRDKLRTQISTGNAPDIFTFRDTADLELFSQSGKLMDMTEFLASAEIAERFQDGAIEAAKLNGINYAFPYESAVIPIIFNKRLLDEAGVQKVPESFDELWDACDKLKAIGVFPTCQMTNNDAWTSMLWYSYAVAACGGPDVYKNGFDDPAFVKAAEIMLKMYDNTSSDAVGADATVVNGHFFNERAAVYTNGSWIFGRIKSEGVEGLYDNLILSPGLSYDGKNGGAYINSVQAYFAAGKQDDPEKEKAVQEFFKFITDPDRVSLLSDDSGALFSIKTHISENTDPLQATLIEQSAKAPFFIGTFQSMVPIEIVTGFPAALESLVLGDTTPEEFVQSLKDLTK